MGKETYKHYVVQIDEKTLVTPLEPLDIYLETKARAAKSKK